MKRDRRTVMLPKALVPILEEIVERRGLFTDVQDLVLFLIRKGLEKEPPTEVEKARVRKLTDGRA